MNSSLITASPRQLRKAANIKEKIETLQKDLHRLLGSPFPADGATSPKRRKLSRAAIANIRAGAKARWATIKGKARSAKPALKPKRKFSAAGRARLSALAKARWKKARAAGKTTL